MGGWYCWILSTPAFPIPEDCVGWKIVPQSLPNISHHQQIRSLSPVLDFKHLMKIYSWSWNYSAFSALTFAPDQINVNPHWQFWALYIIVPLEIHPAIFAVFTIAIWRNVTLITAIPFIATTASFYFTDVFTERNFQFNSTEFSLKTFLANFSSDALIRMWDVNKSEYGFPKFFHLPAMQCHVFVLPTAIFF